MQFIYKPVHSYGPKHSFIKGLHFCKIVPLQCNLFIIQSISMGSKHSILKGLHFYKIVPFQCNTFIIRSISMGLKNSVIKGLRFCKIVPLQCNSFMTRSISMGPKHGLIKVLQCKFHIHDKRLNILINSRLFSKFYLGIDMGESFQDFS